jgi:hypothetical protein
VVASHAISKLLAFKKLKPTRTFIFNAPRRLVSSARKLG